MLATSMTAIAAEENDYLTELSKVLERYQWTVQERKAFMDQAEKLNFANCKKDSCEIVAAALEFTNRFQNKMEAGVQARLAIEIGLKANEMKALKISKKTMTKAAVICAQDVMKTAAVWRNQEGDDKGNGDMVRLRIREKLNSALDNELKEQERERIQKRRRLKQRGPNPPNEMGGPHGPK